MCGVRGMHTLASFPPRVRGSAVTLPPGSAPPRAYDLAMLSCAGLRYLVHISDDLGKKDQVHEYVVKLRKAERAQEQQPPSDTAGTFAQGAMIPPQQNENIARNNGYGPPPPSSFDGQAPVATPAEYSESDFHNAQIRLAGVDPTGNQGKKTTEKTAKDDPFADADLDLPGA